MSAENKDDAVKAAAVAAATATSATTSTDTTNTTSTATASKATDILTITLRKTADRGHADHGWLNTYHTFNFANYYEDEFDRFHSLRVLNEDRVIGGRGFGTHGHREYEIFSYVVKGALAHADSMGNKETIPRGTVQFTSAGTGITHSEHNASTNRSDTVHFLQMWVPPSTPRLKPSYQTKSWDDAQKTNKLALIVSPDGAESSVKINNNNFKMYASILSSGKTVQYTLPAGHEAYVHLIQDSTGYDKEDNKTFLLVNGTKLSGGDGAFITRKKDDAAVIEFVGAGDNYHPAEFLFFVMAKQ